MADASITLPNDEQVVVKLHFTDAVGDVHAPVAGGSVSVDHPEFATATLAATDDSVTIVSVADGVAVVSYTNDSITPAITANLTVTVAEPTPNAVAFSTADAVFSAKP